VVARVLSKLIVDQVEVALDQPDRVRAYPADLRVLLQQQEELEKRRGIVAEHVVIDGLQESVLDLEAGIERVSLRLRVHQDRFLEQLQQHFVEATQLHDRAVVALHELLDGERVGCVFIAKHLSEVFLVIEQQAVFAAPGQDVQAKADPPEECLPVFEALQLSRGEKPVLDEFCQGCRPEMPFGHPADHLDIAKAPGAGLHIRLKVVGRVVIAVVPHNLFLAFLLKKQVGRPHDVRGDDLLHGIEQRLRAR